MQVEVVRWLPMQVDKYTLSKVHSTLDVESAANRMVTPSALLSAFVGSKFFVSANLVEAELYVATLIKLTASDCPYSAVTSQVLPVPKLEDLISY